MEENDFQWIIDTPTITKVTVDNEHIGLWVKLSKHSVFYYQAPNMFGRIVENSVLDLGYHWIGVEWSGWKHTTLYGWT